MIDPRAARLAQMIARNVIARRGYEDGGSPTADDLASNDIGGPSPQSLIDAQPTPQRNWFDDALSKAQEYTMPRMEDYRRGAEGPAALMQAGIENMKSGDWRRMLLGAGQDVLGTVSTPFAPIAGAVEAAKGSAERTFGPAAGQAADVASMVNPDVLPATLSKAARYAPELAIFAGPMAKTADLAALDTAKKMASVNAEPSAIIKETGWFQGADGKWRFEIPDTAAKINWPSDVDARAMEGRPNDVGQFLTHEELAKAYPDFAKTNAQALNLQALLGKGTIGGYAPEVGFILDESLKHSPEMGKSTLLHEMQHYIQEKEGFPEGGNTHMSPDDYKRLAGEVEARNVQTRMNMTPEERELSHPWMTEDVPAEKQVIKYRSKGLQESHPEYQGENQNLLNDIGMHSPGAEAAAALPQAKGTPFAQNLFSLQQKAINTFGKTKNIREAGYVMPDGTMLDFTGRHQVPNDYSRVNGFNLPNTGKRDWMAGERNLDHREVSDIIDAPEGISGTDAMTRFMAETNAIRNKPGIGFEASEIPTDKQLMSIVTGHNREYRGEPISVELSNKHTGDIIASTDFEKPTVAGIKKWFEENNPKTKNYGGPVIDRALALTRALPPSRHMPRSTGTPVVKPLARNTP